jgi:hypothetical protein
LRDEPNKSRGRKVAAAHPDLSSRVFQEEIETSQIAPTIPARVRHRYDELKSVREQQTRPLPGFDDRSSQRGHSYNKPALQQEECGAAA